MSRGENRTFDTVPARPGFGRKRLQEARGKGGAKSRAFSTPVGNMTPGAEQIGDI